MNAWEVYLKTRKGEKWIDTVHYVESMDAEEVKKSLVNHDGYDPGIIVRLKGSNV